MPALARDYAAPAIDTAAMPVRVEQRRVDGRDGIPRGRHRLGRHAAGRPSGHPLRAAAIRARRCTICPAPRHAHTWSLWTYRWRPAEPGYYDIASAPPIRGPHPASRPLLLHPARPHRRRSEASVTHALDPSSLSPLLCLLVSVARRGAGLRKTARSGFRLWPSAASRRTGGHTSRCSRVGSTTPRSLGLVIVRGAVGRRHHLGGSPAWRATAWVPRTSDSGVRHEQRLWQQLSLALPPAVRAGRSQSTAAAANSVGIEPWEGTSNRIRGPGPRAAPARGRQPLVGWRSTTRRWSPSTTPGLGPEQGFDRNRLYAGVMRPPRSGGDRRKPATCGSTPRCSAQRRAATSHVAIDEHHACSSRASAPGVTGRARRWLRRAPAGRDRRPSSSPGTARTLRLVAASPALADGPRQAEHRPAAVGRARRAPSRTTPTASFGRPTSQQQLAVELVGALDRVRTADRLGHPLLQPTAWSIFEKRDAGHAVVHSRHRVELEQQDRRLLAQPGVHVRRRGLVAARRARPRRAATSSQPQGAQPEREQLVEVVEASSARPSRASARSRSRSAPASSPCRCAAASGPVPRPISLSA